MTSDSSDKPTFTIEGNSFISPRSAPGLHIVATPIGNLSDITLRALQTLCGVDLIYCEDTRITSRLLSRYQIATALKPYHDHNGAKVRPQIVEAVKAGLSIALVSDAGTPLISDPGFKLVHQLRASQLPVHMSPGVSAPIMALALSGFPSDLFQFCGFLPPKTGARRKMLEQAGNYDGVSIFFESPKRLKKSLVDVAAVLPDAKISIGRELTKKFEETKTGEIKEILAYFSERETIKGEITMVIWPGERKIPSPDDEVVEKALVEAVKMMSPAKAASEVASRFGLRKSQLYDMAVRAKNAL